LAKITDFIKRAQTSLTRLEDGAVFPQKECDVKGFTPPLPDDLIIEFYVNHASVVVSVVGLSQMGKLMQGLQGLKIGATHRTVYVYASDLMSIVGTRTSRWRLLMKSMSSVPIQGWQT
jgi:hypothetical protein